MAPLLHLKDITVAFGGDRLLDGAELSVAAGERLRDRFGAGTAFVPLTSANTDVLSKRRASRASSY